MSQQLSLVEYPCDENGRLYEPEKSLIFSIHIDYELIDFFSSQSLLEEFSVYEDKSFQAEIKATRIKEDQINLALSCLTAKLIQILESKKIEDFKKIQSDAETEELMGELQIITNTYSIIKLKRDSFSKNSSVILMLS